MASLVMLSQNCLSIRNFKPPRFHHFHAAVHTVSVFFGIRHYFRSQPRYIEIKRADWKEVRSPVQSSEDVRVTIPAKTHKKGKNARVEFLPDALHGYATLLYSVNAPNGEIWIYHVPNSFQYPHHVRECRIKIIA